MVSDLVGRLLLCLALSCTIGNVWSNGSLESGPHNKHHNTTRSDDNYTSDITKSESLKGRRSTAGPVTSFVPQPFSRFSVTARVRLLDDLPRSLGQSVMLMAVFHFADGSRQYVKAGHHPMARAADGWIDIQGDFRTRAPNQVRLKVQGTAPWVRYHVVNASVADVWKTDSWEAYTDRMINELRKSDIRFNVTTAVGNIDLSDVEIQVTQTRKSFPLGTAVNAWAYASPGGRLYRDFIHRHFTWAVHESSMKWFNTEPRQGFYRYGLPVRVLRSLRKNGLKVRGHALMWSVDSMVPSWVKSLQSEDGVRSAVETRIHRAMNLTRGLLDHWDVNNENVHGHWYQRRLQDFGFELTPYRTAHLHDPTVRLFLNDYNVVAHGTATGALVAQAHRLKAADVGLSGLGAQCHFYTEERPDPFLIKDRLDRLADTGLPVWVTEFNVVAADEEERARFVELAMRAFYSHPAVEGILLWGFWDRAHSRGPHAALVTGEHLTLTAAGKKFLDLWENQWMTKEERTLKQSGPTFTVRGFHGDYQVRVRYQGRELSHLTETFQLGKSPHDVRISVYE
ncbi:anti-sigma-I factor RsgI6-like isoform X2 [Babylonia areolata]|uniref:anti-sigma-I factor RsgI6-like isoform X2 n=1 Tax=Babylonia areolata TaxID=304850 RepID=UPI003FCF2ACB